MTERESLATGMANVRGYPEYRSSDVDWLGDLPVHWAVKKLKYLVDTQGGGTPDKENRDYWSGDIPWVSPKDMKTNRIVETIDNITRVAVEESATNIVGKDSILMVVRSGILKHSIPIALADCPVALKQDLKAMTSKGDVLPEFISHLIDGMQTALLHEWRKAGATVESLEMGLVSATRMPVPPLEEQASISEFLDRETGKIDALVAKKEELIKLLQEKRTALITHAVTKGLDPNAPMKDSGIEWLGQIPAHWQCGALSRWWSILDCKHRTVPFLKEGVSVASIGEVHGLAVDLSDANRTSPEEYLEMIAGGRDPRPGDIIYSRNATVGEAAIVVTDEPFCMGQDVSLIRSGSECAEFLLHVLRSRVVLSQLDAQMVGSTFKRINVGQIKKFVLAVPPANEQDEIACYAQSAHDMIGRLVERVRDGILSLHELRTALISAAVTGKIDVRENSV